MNTNIVSNLPEITTGTKNIKSELVPEVNSQFNIIITNVDECISTTHTENITNFVNEIVSDDKINSCDNEMTSQNDEIVNIVNSDMISLLPTSKPQSDEHKYGDSDLLIYGKDTVTCDFCKNKCNIL
jgi:hypothetical protein